MNIISVSLKKMHISYIKNYLSVLLICIHILCFVQRWVLACFNSFDFQSPHSSSTTAALASCHPHVSPCRLNPLLLYLLTQSPHLCHWLLSWKCCRRPGESANRIVGCKGWDGGWLGVGSQWGFSFYRLQWRQNLLGKAINWCLFVFLSVRLLVSTGLLSCFNV